jgi:hypothetical protein
VCTSRIRPSTARTGFSARRRSHSAIARRRAASPGRFAIPEIAVHLGLSAPTPGRRRAQTGTDRRVRVAGRGAPPYTHCNDSVDVRRAGTNPPREPAQAALNRAHNDAFASSGTRRERRLTTP